MAIEHSVVDGRRSKKAPRIGAQPNPRGVAGAKISLLAFSVAVACTSVRAQEATAPEEVVVTGSRIRATSGFETPTPVTALSVSELEDFAPGNTATEQLSSLPQFFGNRTSQQASDGTRFSPAANAYPFLNLRNLGSNRTLVLLDGHRLQPSDKDGTVNPDLLPTALMRSVEVVTGGASAAYGADAVGGVVNFILDREFEGLKIDVGAGQHESGVGDQWKLEIAGGRSFLDDRLNLIGSYENLEIDQIRGDRRSMDSFRRIGWVKNPEWSPGAPPGIPQRLTMRDVVSTHSSPTGLISAPGTPLDRMQFSLDGTEVVPFVLGEAPSLPGERGGTSSMSGGPEAAKAYDTFDNSPSASGVSAQSYFLGLQYRATDRLTFTVDSRGGRTESNQDYIRGGFELEIPWNMLIAVDNAFLPESVRQIMIDQGLDEIVVSKLGSYVDRPEVGSNTVMANVLTQWQASAGFEYELSDKGWILEGYYQKGESKRNPRGYNVIRQDRLYLAMDAVQDPDTGEIVCRVQTVNPTVEQLRAAVEGRISSVPLDPFRPTGVEGNTKPLEAPIGLDNTIRDCVPLNPLGSGNMTQEALDYVTSKKFGEGVVEQDFAELLLTGDAFELPAGPMSFAAGLTWREQQFIDQAVTDVGFGVGGKPVTIEDLGPPLNVPELGIRGIPAGIENGSPNLHLFSTVPNIGGKTDVWEWFGEVQMPLWESASGRRLDMNASFRRSEYDRSGASDSWKLGLDVRLHQDLRLRLTRSQDVREPTFEELFDAQGGGSTVNDPLFDNSSVQTNTLSGGNPDLAPETGKTVTAGIVWQPTFAPWIDGLQIAVDWYDINIEGRVDELDAQRIVDECFNSGILCDRVIRAPDTGQLVNVHESFVNLGEAAVSGTDLEVSWQAEPDLFGGQTEAFSLRWLASFLSESSTTPFGGTPRDVAGELGTPEYTHMLTANYRIGRYSIQLQNRYVDSTILDIDWVEGVDVDDNSVSSMTWWNARFGYTGELNNGATWSLNLNIQNLLDKEPPVVPGFGTRGGTQAFHSSFDIFGRRYNLSANYNF